MIELGFYDCQANYSINLQTSKQETFTTTLHELTHMLITLQSGYGTFMQILKAVKVIDVRYNYIFDFFLVHMKKMQEACSTFSELIFMLIKQDTDAVFNKVNSMKLLNPTYYKFVSPLLFVLNYIDCKHKYSNTFTIPIGEIYNIIKEIAIKSCDVNLTEIPFEFFEKKKSLEKIANIDELVRTYLPNKRFKIAVKELKNQLSSFSKQLYSEEKMELILQNVYSSAFKCNFVKDYSTSDDYRKRFTDITAQNKDFILKLYNASKEYNIILDRIADITTNEISIDRLPAYSIPYSSNNQYELKRPCFTAQELDSTSPSIFFVFGDGKTIQDTLKKPKFDDLNDSKKLASMAKGMSSTWGFYTIMSRIKFKSNILLVYAYNYKLKSINTALIEKKEIDRLNSNVPLVVNYKHYPFFRKYSAALKQDIFVYCDRTYENAIPIINDLSQNNLLTGNLLSYTYNNNDASLSVLIIKIKDHHYFLLPIVRCVEYLIALDSMQNKIKVNLSLELDQNLIDVIDTILNNLYYS